jgi:hypothetical protein
MTTAEMADRVLAEVGEDLSDPVYYRRNEAIDALNEAQRFFVLLTLSLEKTRTLALGAVTTWYDMLSTVPTMVLLLRVQLASTGAKVRPCRLEDLDALGSTWQTTAGAPVRYTSVGPVLAVHPRPDAGGTSLTLTCAEMPAVMYGASSPEIAAEYHPALIDYAVYRLRMKEGGQEFLKELPRFESFMAAAKKMADYVRRRLGGGAYDRLPFELG